MRSEVIDAVGRDGSVLRVEFVWRDDRFLHRISAIAQGGAALPLLESIEGTPADDWPGSPPLQSLSIEELGPGRRAALLVGMAGHSHWSASLEAIPGAAQILFDLACRHTDWPSWLGSRYRILPGGRGRFDVDPCQSRCLDDTESDNLTIQPLDITASTGTTRWKYRLQIAAIEPSVGAEDERKAR